MHGVIKAAREPPNHLGNGAIPLLDPANQQGQSASADHDITHLLAEQEDQNSCVVNGFMTIGI